MKNGQGMVMLKCLRGFYLKYWAQPFQPSWIWFFLSGFGYYPGPTGGWTPPPPVKKTPAFLGGGKAGGTAGSPKPAAKFPFGVLVFSSNFKLVSGGFNFVL